jgi:hypothetical protein
MLGTHREHSADYSLTPQPLSVKTERGWGVRSP